jgi:hypothetical protein
MFNNRLKVSIGVLTLLVVLCLVTDGPAPAQFGFSIVSDPTQEAHSMRQLLNDIQKLQKLDAQIQTATAQYNQIVISAKYFSLKNQWAGFGNQIVRNWAPNSYGATPLWNAAVLFGPNAPQAWQNVTVSMRHNPYMNGMVPGTDRQYAYAASVDTFDGAGPTALQTLGNARAQQTQMARSIANLQTAALDGSAATNSEVEQLNLLTSGTVQGLQMQQTTNNVMTSLLEQQTIANKIQRDALADHLNYETQMEQYMVAEGPQWGGASQAITAARLQ